MIELRRLWHTKHERHVPALEERHGGNAEEEGDAQTIAVEGDGAIEIVRGDVDLTDAVETERLGIGHDNAPDCGRGGQ